MLLFYTIEKQPLVNISSSNINRWTPSKKICHYIQLLHFKSSLDSLSRKKKNFHSKSQFHKLLEIPKGWQWKWRKSQNQLQIFNHIKRSNFNVIKKQFSSELMEENSFDLFWIRKCFNLQREFEIIFYDSRRNKFLRWTVFINVALIFYYLFSVLLERTGMTLKGKNIKKWE